MDFSLLIMYTLVSITISSRVRLTIRQLVVYRLHLVHGNLDMWFIMLLMCSLHCLRMKHAVNTLN